MTKDPPVAVTAALAERGGRVFLARRAGHKGCPGLWELPGGKVENGEAADAALARELREELGVAARVEPVPYDGYEREIRNRRFRFLVYRASWEGDPEFSTDHDRWAYFDSREIPFDALAPLDESALRRWVRESEGNGGSASFGSKDA